MRSRSNDQPCNPSRIAASVASPGASRNASTRSRSAGGTTRGIGTADPAYYQISCTHLVGAPFYAEQSAKMPVLPGFIAVSATNLRGVYFADNWRDFYRPLLEMKPAGVIGYSIYVYRVDRPWWQ